MITPTPTPTNNISFIDSLVVPSPSPTTSLPTPTPSSSPVNHYLPSNLSCNKDGIFNVLTPQFHNLFTKSIDTLLDSSGLSVPCLLRYASPLSINRLCNNCVFNSTTNSSSGIFSVTGTKPFPEGSVCPVCMGKGLVLIDSVEETLNMLVIFDSKYFINLPIQSINIPSSMAQTICCIDYYPKIKNAYEAILNTDIIDITSQTYERSSEPQPMGLGKTKYILTTWKRK